MCKWAVVCVCSYDNQVSSVDLFDSYEDASKFIGSDAAESYDEMKEHNANIYMENCGQCAEIVINGSTDYFWSIEPTNIH